MLKEGCLLAGEYHTTEEGVLFGLLPFLTGSYGVLEVRLLQDLFYVASIVLRVMCVKKIERERLFSRTCEYASCL